MRTAVAVCFAALLIAGASRTYAQESGAASAPPTLTVTGEGEVTANPDFASLDLAITTMAPTLQAASDRHQARAAQGQSLLQSLAGDKTTIERSDFTLDQTYGDPPPDRPNARGPVQYAAQTVFTIKARDLSRLDADLAKIAASGLFEIRGSTFGLDDPAHTMDDARQRAIKAARRSAEAYADAGDFRLVGLQKAIDESAQGGVRPMASMALARGAPNTVALTPPANLSFHAAVQTVWRIAPK